MESSSARDFSEVTGLIWDDEIQLCAFLGYFYPGGLLYVRNITTDEEHRGRGAAQRLLICAIDSLRVTTLQAGVTNEASERLFMKVGSLRPEIGLSID